MAQLVHPYGRQPACFDGPSGTTDATATGVDTTPSGGRRQAMTYSQGGRLNHSVDYGTDLGCADDRRTRTTWTPTGWPEARTTAASTAGCASGDETTNTPGAGTWTATKQSTDWTHFLGGQAKTSTTTDRSGAVVETHTLGYLDPAGRYVNGQRSSDTFTLKGPGSTACAASACTARFSYDPRERLTEATDGHGGTTTYTLDEPARNTAGTIRAGNVTTETTAATTVAREYDGTQLLKATTGTGSAATVGKYWYDDLGNLACLTTGAATSQTAACNPITDQPASPDLVVDYDYDYLDRLSRVRRFTAGTTASDASYGYDALDRLVRETEHHTAPALDRKTTFGYQGLTGLVSREERDNLAPTSTTNTVKDYSYDPYGTRLSMTDRTRPDGGTLSAPSATYTYGYDAHESVSALLDDGTGTASSTPVKAVYGYSAYGATDTTLTRGDTDPLETLNPWRYTGKRLDTGAGALDMGARHYTPDTGRFFTADKYYGATTDLDLSTDGLTGNRYALGGGDPVNTIELDGHRSVTVGGKFVAATGGRSGTNAQDRIITTERGAQSDTDRSRARGRSRPCWKSLSCSQRDFVNMPTGTRRQFIAFVHGSAAGADGWFNAIRGIFDFADSSGVIQAGDVGQGSWFSSVDGVILEGIHDGLARSRGMTAGYGDNRGARAWERFFRARRAGAEQGKSTALWGDAEQATTDFAHRQAGRGSRREELFLAVTDSWRWAVRQDDNDWPLWLWPAAKWHYDGYGNFDPRSRTRAALAARGAWAGLRVYGE